jgi:hypothetical protein
MATHDIPPVPPVEQPAAASQASPNPYAATAPAAYEPGVYATAAGPAQGLSIASMVTGIVSVLLSFVWLGFLPAVAAVVLGHIAQKRQPYAKPFWLTGLITGYVIAGITVVGGLIVVFGLLLFIPALSSYGY